MRISHSSSHRHVDRWGQSADRHATWFVKEPGRPWRVPTQINTNPHAGASQRYAPNSHPPVISVQNASATLILSRKFIVKPNSNNAAVGSEGAASWCCPPRCGEPCAIAATRPTALLLRPRSPVGRHQARQIRRPGQIGSSWHHAFDEPPRCVVRQSTDGQTPSTVLKYPGEPRRHQRHALSGLDVRCGQQIDRPCRWDCLSGRAP